MIRWLARYRVGLGWALALLVIYLASPTPGSIAAGLPFALAGLLVRGIAAGTITKGSTLARTGIYALTRNPLYLGSFLLALGFGVMSGTWISAALLVLPSAAVFPATIRSEEAELRRRFGSEFDAFKDTVPCFIPRRLSFRILELFSYRQFVTNREYNATIGFLAATGVMTAKYLLSVA